MEILFNIIRSDKSFHYFKCFDANFSSFHEMLSLDSLKSSIWHLFVKETIRFLFKESLISLSITTSHSNLTNVTSIRHVTYSALFYDFKQIIRQSWSILEQVLFCCIFIILELSSFCIQIRTVQHLKKIVVTSL